MGHRGGRWCAVASFAVAYGGLLATGVVAAFTSEADPSATRVANRGFSLNRATDSDSIQALHESLSDLMFIVALLGAAWLMVRVKQDWSGLLAAAVGATVIAIVSGWFIRFDAVRIGELFDPEVRGYGFVFDGDLEEVLLGSRRLGPGAFRLWFVLHASSSVAVIVLAGLGYRSSLTPPGDDRWDPSWLEQIRDDQATSRGE